MKAEIEWISVDDQLPTDGAPVVAATTGRYPARSDEVDREEFWLVIHGVFTRRHLVEETGRFVENCFLDSDRFVRFTHGGPDDEVVTHWAYLPNLPGQAVRQIFGDGVKDALRQAV